LFKGVAGGEEPAHVTAPVPAEAPFHISAILPQAKCSRTGLWHDHGGEEFDRFSVLFSPF